MKTERSGWITVIDLLIYAILAGMVLYAMLRPLHYTLQISAVAVSAVIASFLIWTGRRSGREPENGAEAISKVILIDEYGERIKEWFIKGEVSVLIGKNSHRGEVDIDLSDCEYASLVSQEHAVLTRVGSDWFIEDADSESGTGIRKAGRSDTKRLAAEEPERIGSGDMIFIANTRLLVK